MLMSFHLCFLEKVVGKFGGEQEKKANLEEEFKYKHEGKIFKVFLE